MFVFISVPSLSFRLGPPLRFPMPVQASSATRRVPALVRCGRPAASASLHPHPERSKPTRISRGARDADWRGCLSRAVPFRSDGRHQVMPFASWPRRLAERASFSVGNREAQAEPVELSESGRLQESAPYLRVRDCWHRASE
jgi:hypothetical protein